MRDAGLFEIDEVRGSLELHFPEVVFAFAGALFGLLMSKLTSGGGGGGDGGGGDDGIDPAA